MSQPTNPKLAKAAPQEEPGVCHIHGAYHTSNVYCPHCTGSQEEATEPRAARVCLKCGKTEEGWRYNRCPNCGEMADAPDDVCPVSPQLPKEVLAVIEAAKALDQATARPLTYISPKRAAMWEALRTALDGLERSAYDGYGTPESH